MPNQVLRPGPRRWSIVVVTLAALAVVVASYLLLICVGLGCIALPYFLLVMPDSGAFGAYIFWRLLFSAFGVLIGFTMIRSLLVEDVAFEPNGIPIDLANEPALAREIERMNTALKEPMPAQVYLTADANAFVAEAPGGRRILGLGLPLLQMLSIAEFRWLLAHELAHYYSGDTALGPLFFKAQRSMEQVFQNLGKSGAVRGFVRRSRFAKGPYLLLMMGLRAYWKLFMRVTAAIRRRQEFRSDEIACHLAGSQALISALSTCRKCQAGLWSYWNWFVKPAVSCGYQPQLAREFGSFMQSERVTRAMEDLPGPASAAASSPFSTHPSDELRVERAKRYELPPPEAGALGDASNAAISLIGDLGALETRLLRKLAPTAIVDLKPLDWDTAGTDIFIPYWQKQVGAFSPFLSTQKVNELAMLVLDPRPLAMRISHSAKELPNEALRIAVGRSILVCALSLALIDNGWELMARPGENSLEKDGMRVCPGELVSKISSGKLSVVAWSRFCSERGIGNLPLAARQPAPLSGITPAVTSQSL